MNGEVRHRVKWKGYPRSKSAWEPVEHLGNCVEHIWDFEEKRDRKRKAGETPDGRKRRRVSEHSANKFSSEVSHLLFV